MTPVSFVNKSNSLNMHADFRVKDTSIVIDKGVSVGQGSDIAGTVILNNNSPDIGVFEHRNK